MPLLAASQPPYICWRGIHIIIFLFFFCGYPCISPARFSPFTVVQQQSRSSHPQFSHVCPATWIGFQRKCYYFSENETNWKTSLEKCEAMEASLTSIDSQEEEVRTGHEPQHRLWCGKCVGLEQNPIFPQISPTAKARRRCFGESNSPGWGVSNIILFSPKLPPYVQMGAVPIFALKGLPFSVKLKKIHISQIKSPSYCRVPIAG